MDGEELRREIVAVSQGAGRDARALGDRLTQDERKIADIAFRVDKQERGTATLAGRVSTLQTDVTGAEEEAARLDGEITGINNLLIGAQSVSAEHDTQLAQHTQQIADLETGAQNQVAALANVESRLTSEERLTADLAAVDKELAKQISLVGTLVKTVGTKAQDLATAHEQHAKKAAGTDSETQRISVTAARSAQGLDTLSALVKDQGETLSEYDKTLKRLQDLVKQRSTSRQRGGGGPLYTATAPLTLANYVFGVDIGTGANQLRRGNDAAYTDYRAAKLTGAELGDGSDGPKVYSVDTILTGDVYASSIVVNAGVIVSNPNNYRIFCLGDFTNNGTIHNDGTAGTNAVGSTGASAPTSATNGTIGRGATGSAGASGGTGAGSQGSANANFIGDGGNGGSGGAGGTGSNGAGGALRAATLLTRLKLRTFETSIILPTATTYSNNVFSGSGGIGGASGGGDLVNNGGGGASGGNGGGPMLIMVGGTFTNNGTIRANGGAGANGAQPAAGNTGGGAGSGGGGGGHIRVKANVIAALGTFQAAGGTKGTGGAGRGTGTAGNDGTAGSQGTIVLFECMSGTWPLLQSGA